MSLGNEIVATGGPNSKGGALGAKAWSPILAQIRDWVMPATEAPEEYIFASAYTLVGLSIGRDIYVQLGRQMFANSFVCLVGPAALRKGTSWALLTKGLLDNVIDPSSLNFHIVRGTGSAEGLLEQFMEEQTVTGANGRPRTVLVPVPERRVITIEEEMGYFLVKAHSDATANLREMSCQLWDGVDVAPPTRNRSLRVEQPFYSMLAMTTPETLEARLEEDDILSGLLPRFMFFQGTPRPPIPWPDSPSESGARAIVGELEQVRTHAFDLAGKAKPGEPVRLLPTGPYSMKPTPGARKRWVQVYPELRNAAMMAPVPVIGRMLARVDVHIIKAALLYAITAGHSLIEADDLDRAIELGDYLAKTATEAAMTQMGSEVRRLEHKISSLLEQNRDRWWTSRELHQRLSGRIKAEEFHRAIKALLKLGVLESDPPGDHEQPRRLRLKSL